MCKRFLVALLCLGLITVVYISASRPTTSLESVCERLAEQYGDCEKIIFIDGTSNLVFADSEIGIIPVLMSKGFTDIEKVISPLYYQEYKEENKPMSWQATRNLQKDLSLISGFSSDDAKTIIINSEGNIQPNRIFIRDDLWLWYVTIPKNEVVLPVDVTAFDVNGQMIFGGNGEE